MDPIIVQNAELNCDPTTAFELFTKNHHLESWLTGKANVSTEVGGPYELFWQPETPEDNSTIGCRLMAIKAPQYLCFEWKGPVQFKSFMNTRQPLTNVVVLFQPRNKKTSITLLHTGWESSEQWTEAFDYFSGAWAGAFKQLEDYAHSLKQ